MKRAAALGAVALCAFVAVHVSHADATACKRLVFIQFDNTSYGDVRQMPHLLDFLTQRGTIYTNDHTVLISHTAAGILSTLTGLYPDRHGLTVSNSYGYFNPSGTTSFTSAFKYWTDPVDPTANPLPNLITTGKKTTPAPWVPFTRAGCDVGAVGMVNMVPENGSSVGVAIHCSQAATSVCNGNANATPDLLPDEPGGYIGYKAIFTSQAGITTAGSLAAVEQMQESGVPVTFVYLPDAHAAYGPGEAGYVANLKANDDAFSEFFANLSAHGINETNTLFVVTTDEGDHFAGVSGSSYTHTVCTNLTACPANQIGELDVSLKALLPGAYVIHEDSAPALYYYGRPVPTDPNVRKLAQDAWALTSYDPYAGKTVQLFAKMANPLEELALHMVNADPSRTPTLTLFGNPDFFFQSSDCNGVHI
ncbi:MAG TPA: alkaline phosphatase family protein, partial [Gaiellaceae bacterium]|nr:alkaline phosphatase family protein [Gaiellaceae bacterium]